MYKQAKLKSTGSLLRIIICLTAILFVTQLTFFIIHYKVSNLVDSLVASSLKFEIFYPVVLLPILGFLFIQLMSYCLFITAIWFVSISVSELFRLSHAQGIFLSVFVWLIGCSSILCLNNYFFPDSFFATLFSVSSIQVAITFILALFFIALAYYHLLITKKYWRVGSLFVLLGLVFCGFYLYDYIESRPIIHKTRFSKPNIILIGLDSLRPDFTHYLGNQTIATPTIDTFLKTSVIFTNAYTPLARTFPAWMSILTSLYPKHSGARSNLSDPTFINADETLAKRLKEIGYETIYGTDEKRFSNITSQFGFDHILGPRMGVNDFILGGLSDFPLTNLLVNTAPGRVLFPYNYANRAAAITYEPEKFLQLVKLTLKKRSNKPLFLAIHLCLTHWPYQWARDHQKSDFTQAQRYQSSIEEVDKQLAQLLQILKENGLLDSSVVVLLSDHGTTVGLLGDRVISEENYQGQPLKKRLLSVFKLDNTPEYSLNFKKDYSISTSYGQGTDVLSLKQYHVLLAIKGFGINIVPHKVSEPASLLDIAPTVLDFLQLKPMRYSDGFSLQPFLLNKPYHFSTSRPLFLETGYCISEIESKNIFIEQVIQRAIGAYQINPKTGLLFVKAAAEKSIIQNKQLAVLFEDWLLARYPEKTHVRLIAGKLKTYNIPAFFVVVNLKTGQWDIGLDSKLAETAPLHVLLEKLNGFYGNEVSV